MTFAQHRLQRGMADNPASLRAIVLWEVEEMFSLRNRVTYVASQLYWQHGTEGLSAARPRRSIRRLLDPKLEHMRTPGRLS